MAEWMTLRRSKISRQIGSRKSAQAVWVGLLKEKPFIAKVEKLDDGTELWPVEKQFWLKYKREFQGMGFLPITMINETKGIPQMLENY